MTLLRVLVLWGLCVLSFILAGVIVNVYKKDFPLFRYSAMICVLCYLILSFSRPDEWMARYNLKTRKTGSNPTMRSDIFFPRTFCWHLTRSRYQEILEILFPIVRR